MSEMHHECGVAAVYHFPFADTSPLAPPQGREEASRLIPHMLLDVQNRGQLSAGFSTFSPFRSQLLETYKDIGTVTEAFRMGHRGKYEALMKRYAGRAAIGHVRYATCGEEDRNYAQPFERPHLQKKKWFSFAFNGQLANYQYLRKEMLGDEDNHLARNTDTEIIMHAISHELSGDRQLTLLDMLRNVARRFDGAYSLAYLNAKGDMIVARDPLGIKPMCYAKEGPFFAAASESVALLHLGFPASAIKSLPPGQAIIISGGEFHIERFAESTGSAHCFFEWVYFANVASLLDGRSVYLARTVLGEELAKLEDVPPGDDLIVVPVPDTSKAAADAMAYRLGIPCREGLIRNRYVGRTFIEGVNSRRRKVEAKYTPLPEVLRGKRVLLVEDSIVRSTTLRVLLDRIRLLGGAREVHVRVASPPIIAPCFYGIDMSTVGELFAPKFLKEGKDIVTAQKEMARDLGADSLRYLPVEAIARAIGFDSGQLCQACITRRYPTPAGDELYQIALGDHAKHQLGGLPKRTYESQEVFS